MLAPLQIAEEILQIEDVMVEVLILIFQSPCLCLHFEDPDERINILC